MKYIICGFLAIVLLFSCIAFAENTVQWKTGNYVDEFGDMTGEKYTYISTTGVFSNSATTNSKLAVMIIADVNFIEFELLEYGDVKLTNLFSNPTYTIKVKDGNDEVHTFSGKYVERSTRILLNNQYKQEMQDIFKNGGKIRFSITDDNAKSSHYQFAIDNMQNFDKTYLEVCGLPSLFLCEVNEGIATVVNGEKMGALDIVTYEILIPSVYDIVNQSHEGIMAVYNGEYIILDGSNARIQNGMPGKWGFVKADGTVLTECIYDYAANFSCGRACVKSGKKYGYIDTDGNEVIPCQYDYAYTYAEDYACVFVGSVNQHGSPMQGTYSFIDLNGSVIYESDSRLFDFKNGLSRVSVNGKFGYINTEGKIAIEPKWAEAGDFNENERAYVITDHGADFINQQGEVVASCNYDKVRYIGDFHDGMAYVRNTDYRYGFCNEEGELVIPCQYKYFTEFINGYAGVEDNDGKWGIIDKQGKTVVPFEWDEIKLCGDYFKVRKYTSHNLQTGNGVGGVYGLVDGNGNVIFDVVYDSIKYGDGYYTLSKDSLLSVFNSELNQIH